MGQIIAEFSVPQVFDGRFFFAILSVSKKCRRINTLPYHSRSFEFVDGCPYIKMVTSHGCSPIETFDAQIFLRNRESFPQSITVKARADAPNCACDVLRAHCTAYGAGLAASMISFAEVTSRLALSLLGHLLGFGGGSASQTSGSFVRKSILSHSCLRLLLRRLFVCLA